MLWKSKKVTYITFTTRETTGEKCFLQIGNYLLLMGDRLQVGLPLEPKLIKKISILEIEQGYIYHIYNQGNNRGKVFFERKNYLFFLKKLWKHVVPYCDILAYCLMPNHFHLMVLVNRLELKEPATGSPTPSRAPSGSVAKPNFNKSVGIMLASYTRAINKQEGTTGSLFRRHTKAECINCPNGITPTFYATEFGTQIHVSNPEEEYPQACFNYIHQNPVKAGLVTRAEEWEYSSAKDYAGLRNGKLVNRKVAEKYIEQDK